ncbi:MnuA family membrane nuclease [Mesomycoplasma ovipneumoniae]|uniref:endonuclease/exonuclease/phosphatase family protein n=1 Tax=Mesomycoplasma ovipneumoniae TaxID=29562 RepID=UPI00311C96D2
MKKAILFPLLFAGSATAAGAGGYYIYSTSTGEQTGKGVIINKSSQTSPKKDLSALVDEPQKQEQNQENTQEPQKNVEKDLFTSVEETKKQGQSQEPKKNVETNLPASVEETKKQGQNQGQSQEPKKNVEANLPASVEETKKQEQSQEPEKNVETDLSASVEDPKKQGQNQGQSQEPKKNVETDLSASVEETKKQDLNQEKTPEPEKNVEKDLSASVDEAQKQGQSPEKTPESGKNLEKESPTSIDDTKKQVQNPEKSQESENDLQKDNNQSIRVGFWNILKYTNKAKDPNTAKTYALATVINSSGSDVVGLAEIALSGDGTDIIKELEELNPSAGWKQITTGKYGKENQQEKYTFLYKSSLLETINFEPNSNPYLIQEGINLKQWARPVAAVKFQTKTNIKNDFTLAIGHFDAPGPYKKRNEKADSKGSKQGEQEAGEARDLANVLTEIDKKDGLNNEIIFMGDTNIYGKNTEQLFKSTLESYQMLLDKDENTTLSPKKFGEYANSFDKIFYKGDLKTKNAQKYDLFPIFEKNIVDLEKYDQMRKQDKRSMNYKSGDPKDVNRIRGISDHTMVYFDLELSESDNN